MRQGNTSGAIAEFEEALSRDPALAQAHTNLVAVHQQLGVAEAQSGRLPQAIRHFEAAVREAPQDAAIRYNLGTAYLASGRPREAVVQLREALRLNPLSPEINSLRPYLGLPALSRTKPATTTPAAATTTAPPTTTAAATAATTTQP